MRNILLLPLYLLLLLYLLLYLLLLLLALVSTAWHWLALPGIGWHCLALVGIGFFIWSFVHTHFTQCCRPGSTGRPLQSMSRPTPGLASPSGWCCAQRIQIFMIAGGNHTEISGAPQGRRGCPIVRGYTPSVMAFAMPAPPEAEPSPFGERRERPVFLVPT